MSVSGSCHCGAIQFTLEEAPSQAIECNCSICRRRGSILAAVAPEQFRLTTTREAISAYTFNRHAIRHAFCRTFGCAPFSEGVDLDVQPLVAVNLRCTDVPLEALEVVPFDGASL